MQRWATAPASPIRGMWTVNSILYIVAGAYLYSYNPTTTSFTNLGNITTSSTGQVSMVDNVNQLGIADGIGVWVYTLKTNASYKQFPNAGDFGRVTDANVPDGAHTLAFLGGYTWAEKPGTLFVYVSAPSSAADDMTNWTNVSSLPNYMLKNDSSDYVLAVDSYNGIGVAWGFNSIEYFQNVGTSPNPFSRITGSSQTWGLAALWSRQVAQNTMFFLGVSPNGGVKVMKLNGYTPERVSNSDIEDLIQSFGTYSDATSLVYTVSGHAMYQLNFPSADRSIVLDTLTNTWGEAQSGIGKMYTRHLANMGLVFGADNLVVDSTSTNIYKLVEAYYTDNLLPTKRQAVTRHINLGGNTFIVSEVLLDMETGIGLQTGQGSDPQLMMEVSKDGGRTWGQERWTSIGTVGTYLARAVFRRVGSGSDFVFRFTMTDPVKFTILRGSLVVKQAEGRNGN